MKESRQYSKKIQKLYRALRRRGTREKAEYEEPVDALVYAVVSENLTEQQTQSAIKRLTDYFVDYNDLRVATAEEIAEVLGKDCFPARIIAQSLVGSLRAVFEKYNMLSLQGLKKLGKRPAKMLLERLTAATSFVVDYCMLTALDGHAIPLTPAMIEYLKANQLVDNASTYEEIEGFLARQTPTKNAYEFYALLRHECETPKKRKTKKSKK
jgi:endonuclease III